MSRLAHSVIPSQHQSMMRARRQGRPKISKDELRKLLEENDFDYVKVASIIKRAVSTVIQYTYGYGIHKNSRKPASTRVHAISNPVAGDEPQLIDFTRAPIAKFGTWRTNHVDYGRKLTLEDI